MFNSGRFDPVMGAYEAVVSSGGLSQIRNDSLRLALADFESFLEGRYNESYADGYTWISFGASRVGWA